MHLELSVSTIIDHAEKQLCAMYVSDCGASEDCAVHAAPCMLLTRLTILTMTIASALGYTRSGQGATGTKQNRERPR